MSLSYSEAVVAITTPFEQVRAAEGFEAHYPNVPGSVPPSDTLWARATVRHADGGQSTLSGPKFGQVRYQAVGVLIIQVFCPSGIGNQPAYDVAQKLQRAYVNARGLKVSFYKARINEVGANGGFEQINFLVNFEYDQNGEPNG